MNDVLRVPGLQSLDERALLILLKHLSAINALFPLVLLRSSRTYEVLQLAQPLR
jgi:hypothetical protein